MWERFLKGFENENEMVVVGVFVVMKMMMSKGFKRLGEKDEQQWRERICFCSAGCRASEGPFIARDNCCAIGKNWELSWGFTYLLIFPYCCNLLVLRGWHVWLSILFYFSEMFYLTFKHYTLFFFVRSTIHFWHATIHASGCFNNWFSNLFWLYFLHT